jgi:DNA polymerase-3 subunit delta
VANPLTTYDRYLAAFKNKAFKPVYYFHGPEQYLIYRLQEALVASALEEHERDFNLTIVYGAEADGKAVVSECASFPMMAERRVVLIREFEKMANNELLVGYAKNPNPSSVVMISSSGKGNQNPYKAMASAAESAKFDTLSDHQLTGWITREIEARGWKLKPGAAQMLSQLVGSDLRTLAAEMDKLVSFVGTRTDIVADDVLEVAGHSREFNVFELQRKVSDWKFKESARIMEQMLQVSSSAKGMSILTVSVLSSYFNKLSRLAGFKAKGVPSGQLADNIGVPPYYLKEYEAALSRFPSRGLEEAFGALLAADSELKGGSERDDRLILTLLLRRLSKDNHRNRGIDTT